MTNGPGSAVSRRADAAGRFRIGVDIGGTFTDFVLVDADTGRSWHHKVPSSTAPSEAVVTGIGELAERAGTTPPDLEYFVHGTTLALNTVVQRRGARVALVVSTGSRSLLDLARLRVPQQFSFEPEIARPLVPGALIREVGGRILADGTERRPLPDDDLDMLVRWLAAERVDACAIALLNSYVNPAHELAVVDALRTALPDLPVCASSRIWPEIREYERALVAVMNSYLLPQMGQYLDQLGRDAASVGLRRRISITTSNGGIVAAEDARQSPVQTLLSGPAAGVVGAAFDAAQVGLANCVTFDMGGTSADVSLIADGEPLYSTESTVGDFPVVMPSVDVSAIGAGGGSIAWVDPYGVLKVGPESAGAEPGPASYGRGGHAPTVTDAYLVCGLIDRTHFLGGRMPLDIDLARGAVGIVADKLGQDVPEAAESILRVATSNMVTAFLPLMTKKGVDSREFALLPFGGAGPTHACLFADEIGIDRIAVTRSPGTLCAAGALLNDVKKDHVMTYRRTVNEVDLADLRRCVADLARDGRVWLDAQGLDYLRVEVRYSADMCYHGQAYQIEVPFEPAGLTDRDQLRELFHQWHQRIYHHADPQAATDIASLRVRVIGVTPSFATERAEPSWHEPRPHGHRDIMVAGRRQRAAVFRREALRAGAVIHPPSIVEQTDTTVPILFDFTGRVDAYGNLIVERGA